jgi:hypothetical protein
MPLHGTDSLLLIVQHRHHSHLCDSKSSPTQRRVLTAGTVPALAATAVAVSTTAAASLLVATAGSTTTVGMLLLLLLLPRGPCLFAGVAVACVLLPCAVLAISVRGTLLLRAGSVPNSASTAPMQQTSDKGRQCQQEHKHQANAPWLARCTESSLIGVAAHAGPDCRTAMQ